MRGQNTHPHLGGHAPLRTPTDILYARRDASPIGSPMGRQLGDKAALAIAPGVLLSGVAGGMAFPILPLVGQRAGLSLAFIGVILAANRAARVVASPLLG